MRFQKYLFCVATTVLLYVLPMHAFHFVIVNNSPDDWPVKIALKGSDTPLEHDLGILKANGGIGEKKFTGTQAHTCIEYIKVGDTKLEIFEVSGVSYAEIMARKNNRRDITAYFQNNRDKLNPLQPDRTLCADRRFDIIGNIIGNMENQALMIITKSVYGEVAKN